MVGLRGAGLKGGRLAGALLAASVALSVPVALALPQYRTAAIRQFHYDEGNPLWEYDRRVMACTFCHVKASGGAPWNPFGEEIRAAFRADAQAGGRAKFPAVLGGVLAAGKDADGDGYSDALEVWARTLPGDPQSRPDRPVAEVQAAFGAAGGTALYLPGGGK
ncbi:hypothetical protein [uncultured Deinococcus sp.]|uniref:hypothetical protein n=1 Tax=uncultured Deinococcus sp. TaxID=158789 RepID=UPI002583DEC0|nr:hypothetical protein [uncultured Deinococcus sp.]